MDEKDIQSQHPLTTHSHHTHIPFPKSIPLFKVHIYKNKLRRFSVAEARCAVSMRLLYLCYWMIYPHTHIHAQTQSLQTHPDPSVLTLIPLEHGATASFNCMSARDLFLISFWDFLGSLRASFDLKMAF